MSVADELKETLVAPVSADGSAPSFDPSIPPSTAARLAGRYELLGLLKPENVLIAEGGRVVVTDFGIARAHVGGDDASRTGALLVGTPAYMAPEQIRSEAVIDARADVYALGAVLFEMLTAHQAWSGTSAIALLAARLTTPSPPDPRRFSPSLAPAVAAVVMRCMSEQPADRSSIRCTQIRDGPRCAT